MKKLTCVCSLLLMIAAIPLFAEDCVNIIGTVRSVDNSTLQHVAVFLKESSDVVESLSFTDVNGRFEFQNLEQGDYELRVEGYGFQVITAPISLERETIRQIDVNLRPRPYQDATQSPMILLQDEFESRHLLRPITIETLLQNPGEILEEAVA